MSELVSQGPLTSLCEISKEACDIMAPMIVAFYNSITGDTAKLKADKSVFTIADGIVQHILIEHLFTGGKFHNIVGEEDDSQVNISVKPYTVDDLTVPEEFCDLVASVRDNIIELAKAINHESYKGLTIFIDPIDGTREFSTGLGEQCSVCIGFSNLEGRPVAGIVYRPITTPATYAAGAASEHCLLANLDMATTLNPKGLLTSNGGISNFIGTLINELGFERVPSGGAGNKMLMLLEGKGSAYIQDRGVSRWDTSGAQAVLEAVGGTLSKLSTFIDNKTLESYTYLKSTTNLDFEAGKPLLTPFNATDKSCCKKGENIYATSIDMVKAYSNLCGLLALDKSCLVNLDNIYESIQRTLVTDIPAYD